VPRGTLVCTMYMVFTYGMYVMLWYGIVPSVFTIESVLDLFLLHRTPVVTVFILFSLFSLVFRKITGMSVVGWCLFVKARFMHWTNEALAKRNKVKMDLKMD
jgi:hypothetical protein